MTIILAQFFNVNTRIISLYSAYFVLIDHLRPAEGIKYKRGSSLLRKEGLYREELSVANLVIGKGTIFVTKEILYKSIK